MAVWSQAALSAITTFERYDGEYFLPVYTKNDEVLSGIETRRLPMMFGVSDGNHLSVSNHFSDDGDVPYFRGQDINDFFLDNASPIRIPDGIFASPMMARSHFLEGDVLLSIVGTIGSLAIVPESLGRATGSCKIAILRTKGGYSPFVLAAFLLTRYGQLQIQRNTRGAVQMGLILKDLARVKVPIFGQSDGEQVEQLVKQAIKANGDSKGAYEHAQQLLESELGLDSLKFERPMGYTAKFSELGLSRRIDAEYYDPVAVGILNQITNFEHVKLGTSFLVKNGFPWSSKKFLSDNSGEPVVRIRNIRPTHIELDDLTSIEASYANKIGFQKAHKGDIVVGMDGIKYFYAGILDGNCYINQRVAHLSQRENSKISAEYATFLINSPIGQAQLLRDMTIATTVGHITNKNITRMVVPFVSDGFQKEITSLVRISIAKKQESKQLLEQAKARVEQLIEEAVQA